MAEAFAGKVVLITGGGTGIGAACARWFAGEGAQVAVTGRRQQPIEAVAREIGGLAIQADAASLAESQRVVDEIRARFGGLDVLVANAGIEAFGSVTELDPGEWQQVMDVNVNGVMYAARTAIPAMQARGGGAIVVVASEAALTAGPRYAAYNTSKTALIGLARSMAYDHGGEGVRVNTICPGWVRTEMSEREAAAIAAEKGISTEAQIEALTRYMPLERMAEPAEIAACIGFLASDAASFVTGAVLPADGGATVVDVGTLGFL